MLDVAERRKLENQIIEFRDEVEALVRSFRAKLTFMLKVMDKMRNNLINKDFLESAFCLFDVNN